MGNRFKNGKRVKPNGDAFWFKEGEYHREEVDENGVCLPAVVYADGSKYWYKKGKLHRNDAGPSIEYSNGDLYWYKEGEKHREEMDAFGFVLPAVESSNGDKEWYLNGKRQRERGLPAIEMGDGTKQWYVDGVRHRDGGLPAVEYASGTKEWFKKGVIHRMDGPAQISNNGDEMWAIEGVEVKKEEHPWWISEQEKKRLHATLKNDELSVEVETGVSQKKKKVFGL